METYAKYKIRVVKKEEGHRSHDTQMYGNFFAKEDKEEGNKNDGGNGGGPGPNKYTIGYVHTTRMNTI